MTENEKDFTNVEIVNGYIAQGWAVLLPPGCVVRAQRRCDSEPREFRVDQIEIEIDMSFSLLQINESGDGDYFDPEDVIEVISIPEDWINAELWWRRPNSREERS